MAEKREKVIYSFIHQASFTPDEEEQKELNELARKRVGFVHKIIVKNEDGINKSFAIVEDAETGVVNEIEISLITYLKQQ